MLAATRRFCSFSRVSNLLLSNRYNVILSTDCNSEAVSCNVGHRSIHGEYVLPSTSKVVGPFNGLVRCMSTSKGRSMRSKVERRMRKESGKTLREIRRAKKIKKKLMTEEERLLYNLKRAKKKVALLLQQLKKYELPELPPPRHDPELLTPEQLQAYKKIGFRNRNYVPVGVRGVFGGVVQNMHLHWKFHETVQVCCDNFPKEKIKEMATMLARLSGGIVVNIHDVKTIIMFRGRNYRQPKNLIPINTLTKRKALFKARFEQALDSQKLNIKKIEQELRRKGINPEDPVAMASIQRVASTFFNAIDKKEGTPYVFYSDKQAVAETKTKTNMEEAESDSDSDQEELDRFIAEIEDAADRDWVAEEAAEKEELSQLRYRNREEHGGRFRKSDMRTNNDSDDEMDKPRVWRQRDSKQRLYNSEEEDGDHENEEEWDSDDGQNANNSYTDDSDGAHQIVKATRRAGGRHDLAKTRSFERNVDPFARRMDKEASEPENMLSDLENTMWQSDEEEEDDMKISKNVDQDYKDNEDHLHHMKKDRNNRHNDYDSSIDEPDESYNKFKHTYTKQKQDRMSKSKSRYNSVSKDTDSGKAMWDSDDEDEKGTLRPQRYDYWSGSDEDGSH
ncbi:CRM-domain containing factor CFM9, mitochondrial isoform X2 [Cucumis sativus]|uniref:CRM-domain containing factor CFM9, mitochondrial isoform X2 n=1 Tax=Cucumis sativus TaxID=3659 RepID=UPI0005EC8D95|nr:CRM-domain containing factor CFM9, mitochondrial isoform X2 [Cucumis sativus]